MSSFPFLGPAGELGPALSGTYDPVLVVLSGAVSTLAAFASLAVVDRVLVSRTSWLRQTWLLVGAVAMGSGIWAMHFTGMLAFSLPVASPMGYEVWTTPLSVVPGILGSGCALRVMSRTSVGWWRLQLGSLLLAAGIGAMHYTGMAAMRGPMLLTYKPVPLTLSLVVAHVLAGCALYTRFVFAPRALARVWLRPASAIVMGSAVAGMHYTAMAAARFHPNPEATPQPEMMLSPVLLGVCICTVVTMILALTVIGTVVDRRLDDAARMLTETSARYRLVVDTMADGLVVIDDQALIRAFNPAAEKMFGHSAEEAIGKNVSSLMPEPYRGDHDRYIERYRSTGRARILGRGRELEGLRKDGSLFPLELMVSEMRIGDRLEFNGVLRDISARRSLESQLRQAQKLEAVGRLAAGIAHEINTPTQYVGDNIRFLQQAFHDVQRLFARLGALTEAKERAPATRQLVSRMEAAMKEADVEYLGKEAPRALQQCLEGVERIAKIVGAMKEFSHPGSEMKQAFDLNRAIESTITVARNEWKYVAEMVTDFDPDLPAVPCLPGDFNQVILNLIVNAAHAIADATGNGSQDKGTITISTRRTGESVEIRVTDTGTGIPENVRNKIFDPFFTTKGIGQETGQGLSIAHAVVVQKHQGTISVESEVGSGTSFLIHLPLGDVPGIPGEVVA